MYLDIHSADRISKDFDPESNAISMPQISRSDLWLEIVNLAIVAIEAIANRASWAELHSATVRYLPPLTGVLKVGRYV
jgi:hypothetical protein